MKNIILGTDWWTDCDDAVALRLITKFVKNKSLRLLGVCMNACMEYSVASLKGFLRADGLSDIPIGIDTAANDFTGTPSYQKRLAKRLCPEGKNSDAEDGVRLYRRLLACAEGKVDIIEIGFLQALVALFESGADDISQKSGLQLVREKVDRIWVMAGKWDEDGGLEHNFCNNARACVASEAFCRECPVPVTFLGWEVGRGVITGGNLDKGDHLYQVLSDHGSAAGRHSWDPMLVLMAIIGDEEEAGYRTVRGRASVDAEDGGNHFTPDEGGPHAFVIKKHPDSYYEKAINELLI